MISINDSKNISEKGLSIIEHYEGLYLSAYWDEYGKVWTIGWGHTKDVYEGMVITREQAVQFLKEDCIEAEKGIKDNVIVPLSQDEFDSLTSLIFNVGIGSLVPSTLMTKLNSTDYDGCADEFRKYIYSGGVILPGLVKRRETERTFWLTGKLDFNPDPPEPPTSEYKLKNKSIYNFNDRLLGRKFTSVSNTVELIKIEGDKAFVKVDNKKVCVPKNNLIKVKK